MAAYLIFVGRAVRGHRAVRGLGGPPWWPVAVGTAGVAAFSAAGFAVGAYFRSRFAAPLAAFGALAAVSALAAGAAAGQLPGGTLAMLRNVVGAAGIGLLLSAAVTGGALAWAGPMAYLLVTESALAAGWTTPWIWAARPPDDLGAALCAALVFTAGATAITVRGSRYRAGD